MGEGKLKPRTALAPEAAPLIYVALTGLNYGCTEDDIEGTRLEPGAEVPASVVNENSWLLEQGHVAVKGETDG